MPGVLNVPHTPHSSLSTETLELEADVVLSRGKGAVRLDGRDSTREWSSRPKVGGHELVDDRLTDR